MLPSFGNLFIYTQFKINQDEIARTICVQKEIKDNTCMGHCALKKSLKQFDDNEKKMDNFLKEKAEIVYIQIDTEINYSIIISEYSTPKHHIILDKKPISVILSNFRPPSFFV